MITSFGKFCRILRIENNELLKNMSDKLGVSSAFLSSVENGKKEIPESWYSNIVALYSLSNKEADKLYDAILSSKKELKINLKNLSNEDLNLAVSFARKFESLSEEKKADLKKFFDSSN